MKLAVAQSFFYIQPVLPNLHQAVVRCPPPPIATSRRHTLSLKIHLSPKSHQTHNPNPQTTTTQYEDDDGIPIEHVKTLVKFKSRYNYIRVLEVSRRADHTLAGSRLLLLDAPGNIHSISYLFKSITNTYFDVFATLPPLLPPGPLGILGYGAGSAAKLILETYSQIIIHGWELDQSVISVAREYFGLAKMEAQYPDRLFIHIGNALNASIRDGFSGILIDLFSKGVVIPELQNPQTWYNLRKNLKRGGRIMVNVGGNCVEPEDIRKDGSVIMEETLKAMHKVFPNELFVLSLDSRKEDSSLALTGEFPDVNEWKKRLKKPLKFYVDMWAPYKGSS
ncbi:S-adenosyl-L-methionine-dependent methyltransferase superfamily protein [Forsythia ovata]|uniref:S-adenosyl-L-methionine-dependent methyltransferase superfamily protein n=2 Tax=Forsythia ovata TaxID=205694 RepID=A0ABD1P6N7_9LAMI